MDAEEVKNRLTAELSDCDFDVRSEGNHFLVIAVGERFSGMNRVKKQQLIYAVLDDALRDGSIHALTIKAFTPDEWQAQQG